MFCSSFINAPRCCLSVRIMITSVITQDSIKKLKINKTGIAILRDVQYSRKTDSDIYYFKTISPLAPRKVTVIRKYVIDSLYAHILASRVCGVWGVSKLIAGLGSVFFMRLALHHIATYKLKGKMVQTM